MVGPDLPIILALPECLGCKETFPQKELRCGDVSMGGKHLLHASMKTSVQTPASKQTPAGHGGPPAISAMGRKKQGLLEQTGSVDGHACNPVCSGQSGRRMHVKFQAKLDYTARICLKRERINILFVCLLLFL